MVADAETSVNAHESAQAFASEMEVPCQIELLN
jgi:hypothetical protein